MVSPGGKREPPSEGKPTGGVYDMFRGVLGSDALYSPRDALRDWKVFGVDGSSSTRRMHSRSGGVVSVHQDNSKIKIPLQNTFLVHFYITILFKNEVEKYKTVE